MGPQMSFDNAAVVMNTTKPESTLKKKHNAIAYHHVREAQAAGVIWIAKEDGETNLADVLTRSLPGPQLRTMMSLSCGKETKRESGCCRQMLLTFTPLVCGRTLSGGTTVQIQVQDS